MTSKWIALKNYDIHRDYNKEQMNPNGLNYRTNDIQRDLIKEPIASIEITIKNKCIQMD